MNETLINEIVEGVMNMVKESKMVEVEASGRHIHLCRSDVETLFGSGYELVKVKDLSQPGQFACKERVTIEGSKGKLENVVVLGPERPESQVELSLTDAATLGMKIPIKQSGDISGTPGVTIISPKGRITINKGTIVAKRHIHLTPEDAKRFGIVDGEIVDAKVYGKRPLIFEDVVARVSEKFQTYMHIDYDEANACGYEKGNFARIMTKQDKQSFISPKTKSNTSSMIHSSPTEPLNTELIKKVITESDLNRLFFKGIKKVVVSKNSIITPLGEDFIKSHYMIIERKTIC